MAKKLLELRQGQRPSGKDFNILVKRINALSNISGRNGVRILSTPRGISVIGTRAAATSAGTAIHKAYATEDAGRFGSIDGSLDSATGATNITINFEIAPNSASTTFHMHSAIPFITTGQLIPVFAEANSATGWNAMFPLTNMSICNG